MLYILNALVLDQCYLSVRLRIRKEKDAIGSSLLDILQDKYFFPHFGPFFLHMRFLFQAITTFFRTPVHVYPCGLGKQ